jgi:hypothetical protein
MNYETFCNNPHQAISSWCVADGQLLFLHEA